MPVRTGRAGIIFLKSLLAVAAGGGATGHESPYKVLINPT